MKNKLKGAIDTLKQQKIVTQTSMIYNFVWASGKILLGVLTGAYFLCISGTNTLLIGFIKKTYVSNSKESDKNLKENKIFQSMSRKGNCYDNSVMENFFGLLKQEMYYGITYYSFEDLKEAIEKYIVYYNEKRIKEKLGWMSPVEYRLSAVAA